MDYDVESNNYIDITNSIWTAVEIDKIGLILSRKKNFVMSELLTITTFSLILFISYIL